MYGPGDNYDLQTGHVLPALIRKFHEAKVRREKTVTLWGSGTPRREFVYSNTVLDRKSTRLNSSHVRISYAVFCLKKKNTERSAHRATARAHSLLRPPHTYK